MKTDSPLKLGISVGDLNGVGCEVALKSFMDKRMLEFCTPIFFASNKIIADQKKALELHLPFQGIRDLNRLERSKINVFNCIREEHELSFGASTTESGTLAKASLQAAVKALKEKKIDALVTAPINKSNIQAEDFSFPGHTDYLAQELEGNALMFMVSDQLRVGLLTDHVGVGEVPKLIDPALIVSKVKTMSLSLQQDFGIGKPKIAVLGINPHSGDNGTIGTEDEQILKPSIKKLFQEGELVFGPFSADSFFTNGKHLKYDAVLAAYHDQGLIPFKTLSFGQGVNFTAGLSGVRTSPDHGTAYDIAGKNTADESSFKEAVYTAIDIYRNRLRFREFNRVKAQ